MATRFFLIFQASCLAQPAWACKENCEDSSALQLQSHRRMTCPHGEEEYTLAEWAPKLYTAGDVPASGISITSYVEGDPACLQPAILSSANVAGARLDVLACNCHALVNAAEGSTDANVSQCPAATSRFWGIPTTVMTFDEPQDITSVTFYNVQDEYNTAFVYTTASDETVEVGIPLGGRYNPSVVDLTQQEIKPQNVKIIKVALHHRSAFTGMTLCKGGGSLVGDPHVRTQDHAHYTVLNEGNFLAWRYSHTADEKPGLTLVDWLLYAHYSGQRRAWTRGLLLVDQSMGSHRQSLEFTSEECKLRKRVGRREWKVTEASGEVAEAGEFVTGFHLTRLEQGAIHFDSKRIWTPKGKKVRWDAKLVMATPRGKQLVATVQLRCFPGKHIDVQVIRERMADARKVEGQLGRHRIQLTRERNGLGHWFHTSSDNEFQLNQSWTELGGSSEAAVFMELEDQKAKAVMRGNPTCSPAEKHEAMRLCQETMKASRNAGAEFLDECILDICAGGGVAAAELAGDIFSA